MSKTSEQAEQADRGETEAVRVPIVEERVEIGARVREGRTVSVTTRPVTEEIALSEPFLRERVSVERIPVNRVVSEAPRVREEGDLTIIPVVEERVIVTVELVLAEEIHLRRSRETDKHEETVELRRTEVDVAWSGKAD